MREINYKLIASDFDGTLITNDQQIPDSVKNVVNEYVSNGGIFAICTGRMLKSILPRARELNLKGLIAAYQGTLIADIESGKILKDGGMSAEDTAEVCRYLEESGCNINVYCDEQLYSNIDKSNKVLKIYEEITGVDANYISGKISEFVIKNAKPCYKIACLVLPSERDKLYNKIRKKYSNRFDVTCSASVLVEISPLCDNKGNALEYIANYYGIDLSQTVAIGDNLNDLSMIEKAGIGCAVGNAEQRLKNSADFVAITNNDGAVAQIIEKFGFK